MIARRIAFGRLAATALTASFTLLISASSSATDEKRYAGSFCMFSSITDSSGNALNATTNPSKFQNKSGSTQTVTCPVLSDIVSGDLEYAHIYASSWIDESTCRLYERRASGSYGTWVSDDVVANPGTGYNYTRWFVGGGWGNGNPESSFSIACSIPNNALVLNYYVTDR